MKLNNQVDNALILCSSAQFIDYCISSVCYFPTVHTLPSQHTCDVHLLHLLQDTMFLCLEEGLCHHCPGGGRMVPEPPLEECLILLGGIRGLLFDSIPHRLGDLKPVIQSNSTPPVSHATKYTPQLSWS